MSGGLHGKRIVITRAQHQIREFADLLAAEGAQPLAYPAMEIAAPLDTDPLDGALAHAANTGFDWLIFTSANAVSITACRWSLLDLSAAGLPRLAAVGAGTAAAVRRCFGSVPVVTPSADASHAAGLAQIVAVQPGDRVLLPQSERASGELAAALIAQGAHVTAVEAYRVVPGRGGVDLPRLLAARQVDAITFTSGSTVEYFLRRYVVDEGGDLEPLNSIVIACMGKSAFDTAQSHGLIPVVRAETHTLSALIESLKDYFHAS